MTKYNKKITTLMYPDEFNRLIKEKKFLKDSYLAFIIVLYYTGIRVSEALNLKRECFKRMGDNLYIDVGHRLKGSKVTPPLIIPLSKPHINFLVQYYLFFEKPNAKIFLFSRKTAYNICKRFFGYPHYYRLNRVTLFLIQGFTIPHIKTWFGLNAKTIDHYIGVADMHKMSKSL